MVERDPGLGRAQAREQTGSWKGEGGPEGMGTLEGGGDLPDGRKLSLEGGGASGGWRARRGDSGWWRAGPGSLRRLPESNGWQDFR